MAQPTQLTPTEQDALVKQIGLAMLRVAPEDWEQLTVDYRAVGRYAEATGQVIYTDGATEPWTLPPDLQGLFARLRGGMYREGRGTWYNARYRLDHPSSYNLEYDREEPVWDLPPPPQAYPDDMRIFPRSDDNVPEWLHRRLTVAPPGPLGPPAGPSGPSGPPVGPPTPRFRVARIFDGPGEDGRPSVNRPPIDEVELPELLVYLDGAPLVGPARGYDVDRLDPEGRQSVPVAFHTDGIWIWPAAVNYYLREHDVAAEPDLVEHVRRMRFRLPQVDEPTRSAAQLFLGPPPAPAPPPRPAPTRALPVAPPRAPAAPPPAALPSQGPPGRSVDQLRTRLVDLGVPESAYRIGPPAGRAWTMEQTDEGWRVGWYDREFVAPAMFEDVADASAFLLGKLMLDADRWGSEPAAEFGTNHRAVRPGADPAAERRAPHGADFGGTRALGADLADPGADFGADPAADPGFDFGTGHRPRITAYGADPDFDPGLEPDFDPGADPGRRSASAADPGIEFAADAGPNRSDRRANRTTDPSTEFSADPGPNRGDRRPTHATDPGIEFGADRTTRSTDPGLDRRVPATADPGVEFDRTTRTFATDRGDHTAPYATDPGDRDPDRGSDLRSAPRPDRTRAEHGTDPNTDLEFEPMSAPLENFEPPAPLPAPLPPPPPAPPPVEPTRTMAMEPPGPAHREPARREPATMLQQRSAAAAAPGSEWPITPLPGEPPLTLFRGKRLMELEPGTEIDRFGDDNGNLVYAVGTPFPERSLVPEWIDRPYHAYRVRQPVQVLAGAAIPWFDQPGGGTAYLLPDAVGALVAHGQLVELDDRERPRG